jgi:hypothetical protein
MRTPAAKGTSSRILHVFIQDSTATNGDGKTALVYSDITAYYVYPGGTLTLLTMETIATLGTWASSGNDYLGFKLLHDTNAPGVYELHLPNNIFGLNTDEVTIQLRASGAAPCLLSIPIHREILAATVDDTVAPSTTEFETSEITEATADHFIGRVIVFLTGALAGQATTIADYALNTGRGHFTVTAMTDAPAAADLFRIY